VLSFGSAGQQKFISQGQYWIRYYNQARLSAKTILHVEVDERRKLNPSGQFQFFMHVHVHRKFKPWLDAAAGGNFNYTQSTVNTALAVPEWRPWQEFNLFSNAAGKRRSTWQFRYRLDERFIHNNDKIELLPGYYFALRHRFRVMWQIPITSPSKKQGLSMRVAGEVMFNSNTGRRFDQSRVFIAGEWRFNEQWVLESGYLNLIQPKNSEQYFDRHIIRTTIYHRIQWRKEEREQLGN
jgi:hypothetical protein